MTIVFYISGHGLGHASRDIEVIHAILARRPDARIVIRTGAEAWLFALNVPQAELQPCEVDTGVVQIDSLRLDEELTARAACRFYADFDDRAAGEARRLRDLGTGLVIGDIPPLAFAAADREGIASVALGNFTWDWIYSVYPAFDALAPDVIPTLRAAYATATRALRLPFHGGFEPMSAVTRDIPLIARRSRRDRRDTRRQLGVVTDAQLLVLACFSAYGAPLPANVSRGADGFTLLTVDRDPPHGLAYQDLVAAADVVVSKPGYGIVSECIANDTALLYTSRGRFIEYDRFVAEMPRRLRCRYISQEDLFAGRIADTGRDPVPIMTEAVEILHEEPNAELIWASPRELLNIFQADAIGCHIITVTNDILAKLANVGKALDEYSLDTVKMFYNDARKAGFTL